MLLCCHSKMWGAFRVDSAKHWQSFYFMKTRIWFALYLFLAGISEKRWGSIFFSQPISWLSFTFFRNFSNRWQKNHILEFNFLEIFFIQLCIFTSPSSHSPNGRQIFLYLFLLRHTSNWESDILRWLSVLIWQHRFCL